MKNMFTAKIERFKCVNGWHYVTVPEELVMPLKLQNYMNQFGYIAITAKVRISSWDTSIMPMGDKTDFIALPAKIRKKEKLALGDEIEVLFELRVRG
jgi:Domain of unknown function (DUF1905).